MYTHVHTLSTHVTAFQLSSFALVVLEVRQKSLSNIECGVEKGK